MTDPKGYLWFGSITGVKPWLLVALLLAVAIGAFQGGMLFAERPPKPECNVKITIDKVDCHYQITGSVGKVEIKPVDGGRFPP